LIAFVLILVSALMSVQASPLYTDDKRSNFNREFMHFGKRAAGDFYDLDNSEFNRAFMPFGKRDVSPWEQIVADKKNFNREFLHFGKRSDPFAREFMHFGKRR